MKKLLIIFAAMTGPAVYPDCEMIKFITTVCRRSAGDTAEVCTTDEPVPYWTCRSFDPHWFSWDLDHDGDIDMRDVARWQNGLSKR